ncbi:RNA-binding S4 domain-containing protein [Temperatibacter marinus]|uniref:RNA-binding S4 domain-containing protein n=1 Tax=Temperatibacter marinus TaxID=1456591 RepID=A0AA52HBE4_9PROT|nr:RNA-binding S4 domain-containing protein [Temperatibacter marinus]WND03680.1 RNA-binding S4 domain-containing protein [Temperatibacter marinus]
MTEAGMKERVDIWLWHARFFKTRSIATKLVKAKKVRVNGTVISKPSSSISVGDVLTFVKEGDVRIIEIKALSTHRGPYSEAKELYEDLSPDPVPKHANKDRRYNPAREQGMGRPTKKDRRAYEKLTESQE